MLFLAVELEPLLFRCFLSVSSLELELLKISFRLRACNALALFLSIGRGLHTSQRYSSGMLFLSRPIHTTCCHTLTYEKHNKNIVICDKSEFPISTYRHLSQQIMYPSSCKKSQMHRVIESSSGSASGAVSVSSPPGS